MRKPGTAFESSAFQDCAPAARRHAFKKTVLAAALAFFWLISPFRHGLYLTLI